MGTADGDGHERPASGQHVVGACRARVASELQRKSAGGDVGEGSAVTGAEVRIIVHAPRALWVANPTSCGTGASSHLGHCPSAGGNATGVPWLMRPQEAAGLTRRRTRELTHSACTSSLLFITLAHARLFHLSSKQMTETKKVVYAVRACTHACIHRWMLCPVRGAPCSARATTQACTFRSISPVTVHIPKIVS
jgi:hypothetical protein